MRRWRFWGAVLLGFLSVGALRGLVETKFWVHTVGSPAIEAILRCPSVSSLQFVAAYATLTAVLSILADLPVLLLSAAACRIWRTPSAAATWTTSALISGWCMFSQFRTKWPPQANGYTYMLWEYAGGLTVLLLFLVFAAGYKRRESLRRIDLVLALVGGGALMRLIFHLSPLTILTNGFLGLLLMLFFGLLSVRVRSRVSLRHWHGFNAIEKVMMVVAAGCFVPGVIAVLTFPKKAPDLRLNQATPGSNAPNIVLIVVDCLRADSLSCYNPSGPRTPSLDSLARSGVRFRHAWTAATWTLPSVTTMLTGLYPSAHGVTSMRDRLPSSIWCLPEHLQKEGFATGAFVSCAGPIRQAPLSRGFDILHDDLGDTPLETLIKYVRLGDQRIHFFDFAIFTLTRRVGLTVSCPARPSASELTDRALKWMEQMNSRPAFVYLHLLDAHPPYGVNLPAPDLLDHLRFGQDLLHRRDLYLKHIADLDEVLGHFLKELPRVSTRPTLIVLTGDHGEEIEGDKMVGHGRGVSEGELCVPLIFSYPPRLQSGQVRDDLANLVDLPVTLLRLIDIPHQAVTQGLDLFAKSGDRRFYNVGEVDAQCGPDKGSELRAVIDAKWKLVTRQEREGATRRFLFQVADDGVSSEDVAGRFPEIVQRYASLIEQHRERSSKLRIKQEQEGPLFEGDRRRLQGFGYNQ